ncbi:hypothetical protein LCGC14_2314620 [marine sediment metagenome]|uniref:Uncharacterized protein n=1 Tax=marine sediment metagenome TaxID=412755 RepID=A0A0F9CJN0_9ZZZZ
MAKFPDRLSIPIHPEVKERLNDAVPEGVRAAFVRSIIDVGLNAVDAGGPGMIGLILNGSEYIKLAPKNMG